jgi:hypothetical protein
MSSSVHGRMLRRNGESDSGREVQLNNRSFCETWYIATEAIGS